MAIRVLPTVYAGTAFRSRLEARWAMFFDRLGIRWVYEPEGFELADGTRYLPDFFLPGFHGRHGTYVEVKPEGDAFTKARRFALEWPASVWLLDGPPRWRSWTVLSRESAPEESGQKTYEVIEYSGIPLYLGAWDEYRFWLNPSLDDERDENAPPNILAAIAGSRQRMWEPRSEVAR